MRGVEVKHVRRRDVDLEKVWDVESATGKGVLYQSQQERTSKRPIPLNKAARDAVERMLKRANDLGHTDPTHYVWCASQHHQFDPTKPARQWDTAWRALRRAAGLPGFRFHDLRHTVVTDLLEAGEPNTSSRRSPGIFRGGCWSITRISGSRSRARCSRGWRSGERDSA